MDRKSLDFVNQRIKSGLVSGISKDIKFDSMSEVNFLEFCRERNIIDKDKTYREIKCKVVDREEYMTQIIQYNPDADFQYFTMARCRCDGTMLFYLDLMLECIDNMLEFHTWCKEVEIPKELIGVTLKYTVGDFVLAEEFGDQFTTTEKPWMRSRFTVMLPIKCEVIKENE